MRNVENITELADFIASAKYEFDMGDGIARPECGSAGCIGGHAAVLWPEVLRPGAYAIGWDAPALVEKLGIDWLQHNEMCLMTSGCRFSEVRRGHAVAFLRLLTQKEVVTWEDILGSKSKLEVLSSEGNHLRHHP